jgi:hypothetical protein
MDMSEINDIVLYGLDEGVAKKYQNPEGGLNAKGRAHFKRTEGANLKPPVSKKAAKKSPKKAGRRKSFCARMGGQKRMHNVDCRKDPDKDICKALRKWDCSESYIDMLNDVFSEADHRVTKAYSATQEDATRWRGAPNQASQSRPVNERIRTIIRMVNAAYNSSVPETEDGYNQIGRSKGAITKLAKPAQFAALIKNGLIRIDRQELVNILRDSILSIPTD